MIETDDKDFARDPNSLALVNTNVGEFNQYKQNRKQARELSSVQEDIGSLKDEIQELKKLILSMSR